MAYCRHTSNITLAKQMKYNTIIFDLDGTLMDTLKDLWLSVNYSLRTNNLPERSLEEVRTYVGNGVRLLIQRAIPEGSDEQTLNAVLQTFKEYYQAHCKDNSAPYDGIVDAMRTLRQQGRRIAIVSNKPQFGVTELHEEWFKDLAEVAVGEREGVRRKPAPDMVEVALKELGVSKDGAVYIGDSDVDINTAVNSGMPCVSVLWGFRDKDFLTKHGATQFAEKPSDLLNIL